MRSFHGDWRIDFGQSRIWDYTEGRYVPDEIGEELIRITIEGDVQDYEVVIGDGPAIRLGYKSRYDDPAWVPYGVREVSGFTSENHDEEMREFVERSRQRKKSFTVGDVYGMVRLVYVNERTHYRISKDANSGAGEYAMLRQMAEDGNSYTSYVHRTDGIVSTIRHFVRA